MSEEQEIRAALAANALFYRAFVGGDYPAMEALWATSEPVLCSHPGAPTLHGRPSVMESWGAILAGPPAIEVSDPRAVVIRGLAFVTCLERIDDAVLGATNVFVWEGGKWRMVHHQSGHLAPAETTGPDPGQALH
jgi:hypothetical protein